MFTAEIESLISFFELALTSFLLLLSNRLTKKILVIQQHFLLIVLFRLVHRFGQLRRGRYLCLVRLLLIQLLRIRHVWRLIVVRLLTGWWRVGDEAHVLIVIGARIDRSRRRLVAAFVASSLVVGLYEKKKQMRKKLINFLAWKIKLN